MKTWVTAAVVLAVFFFAGWFLGRQFMSEEVIETTRIDTVFYEKPTPINTSDITVSVDVPRLLFATVAPKPDTVTNQVANQVTNQVTNYVSDSVKVDVTFRTLEYRDSTYYARVSGPVIGALGPSLDYFETYNTTTTQTRILRPRTTISLSGVLGSDYSRSGWSPYLEAALSYNFGPVTLSATAGLDDVFDNPTPRGGIEAAIPLWTR